MLGLQFPPKNRGHMPVVFAPEYLLNRWLDAYYLGVSEETAEQLCQKTEEYLKAHPIQQEPDEDDGYGHGV